MWKKVGIAFISLLSTFTVVFALNQEMLGAGGGLDNYVTLQEGSKLYIGNNEGEAVVWDVMIDQTNQYLLGTSKPLVENSAYCNLPTNKNKAEFYDYGTPSNTYRSCTYGTKSDNIVYTKILQFNASAFSNLEKTIIIDESVVTNNQEVERFPAFIPNWNDLKIGGKLLISSTSSNVVKYSNIQYNNKQATNYWMSGTAFYDAGGGGEIINNGDINLFTMLGQVCSKNTNVVASNRWENDQIKKVANIYQNPFLFDSTDASLSSKSSVFNIEFVAYGGLLRKKAIRPFTVLSKPNIVFAIDATFKNLDMKNVATLATTPGDGSITGAMKLRALDSSITVTLEDATIGNLPQGSKFKLNYSNATTSPNQYISAIIRNDDGVIKYYQRLELAKTGSNNEVTIDTTSIEPGINYHIQLVNEVVDDTSVRVTTSSPLTNDLTFQVTQPLKEINYLETPQKNGSVHMDHLESGVNINNKQVATATITLSDDSTTTYPMNYKLLSVTGDTTTSPFEFRLDGDGDVIKDASGRAIIYAKTDLAPGIYKFRIQAYDDNNDPVSSTGHGIDKSGNDVIDTSYGLISDDIEIVIYPNKDTIKVDVSKKANPDSTLSNFTTTDVNSAITPITLATAKLDPDPSAGSSPVFDASMKITYSLKDVKLNGTAVSSGAEDFQIDTNTGKITKKGTISYGKHEFSIGVTYTRNSKSITLDKGIFSFYIDPDLYFINPEDTSEKITSQTVKFIETDPDHDFDVMAISSSTEIANKILYRVKQTDTSGIVTYKKIGPGNTGIFTANKLGTTTIEAYYKEGEVEVVVKELIIKVVVDALSDLDFTATPQKDSTGKSMTYFAYQINAKKDQQVGTISSKFGAKPITYELLDTTKFYLKPNSDSATLPTQRYECDASGNPIVYAKEELAVGVYTFKLRAYDAMNEPFFEEASIKYGIDKEGNKVTGYDKGLISDEYTLVVYPNESQITYTQIKKDMGTSSVSDDEFFTTKDINETDKKLGLIEFAGNAYIQTLKDEGYVISSVELLAKGTSTPLTELQAVVDLTNVNKYDIKKKGTVTSGTKNFDIKVTFKDSKGASTAIIVKSDQSFYIAPELQYVNPDKTTEFLSKNEYTKTYDPENLANNFTLIATDKSDYSSNSSVKYCIVKDGFCDSATNAVITLVDHGNGTSTITAKAPGTSNQDVIVRAYTVDGTGNVQTTKDIKIIVTPAKQILAWEGTNIQTTGNNITKDTTAINPTWLLELKYNEPAVGETVAAANSYAEIELYKAGSYIDNNIGLRSNVIDQGSSNPALHITYTVTAGASDTGKVSISGGKLIITDKLDNPVIITAKADATGNYAATIETDNSATPANDVTTAVLKLSVSDKAKVEYRKNHTEDYIVSGDDYATGADNLGTVSISPPTETGFSYTVELETVDLSKPLNDPTRYAFSSKALKIVGDKLIVDNSSASNYLTKGTYRITISAKRTVGGIEEVAVSKIFELEVIDQTMNKDELKWQSKIATSFSDVGGVIAKTTGINNTTFETPYKQDGSFYVNVVDVIGKSQITGTPTATIKYKLKTGSTPNIIELVDADTGKFKILTASPSDASIIVEAAISKTGYEDTIVYLPIKITQGIPDFQFTKQDGNIYTVVKGDPTKGEVVEYKALTKSDGTNFTYVKDDILDVITAGAPEDADVTIKIVVEPTISTGNDVLQFNSSDTTHVTANGTTPVSMSDKVCVINKSEDYASLRNSTCLVQIQNALKKYEGTGADINKVYIVATTSETAEYKSMSMKMPVNIDPAVNDVFDFKENPLYVDSTNNWISFDPTFEKSESDGLIELILNKEGVLPDFTNDEVQLGDMDTSNTTYVDGITGYKYNILVSKDETVNERVFHVYAYQKKSRNYKESDTKELAVHVAKEGLSKIKVKTYSYSDASSTTPQTSITYGDAYFKVVATSSDDEDLPAGVTPTYSYDIVTGSEDYMDVYGSDGNTFIPKKVGTDILVEVTRSVPGQSDTKTPVKLVINPKTLKMQVADVNKKAGQQLVTSDFKFTSTSEDFLATDKAIIGDPVFTCLDVDNKKIIIDKAMVSVEKDNNASINASFPETLANKEMLKNYKIRYVSATTTGIEPGKLLVSQDESQASWFEVKEGTQADSSATVKGSDDWYNGPVDILLKTASDGYDLIGNAMDATFDAVKFTVKDEGEQDTDIYFRKSTGLEKDAISKPQTTKIKIDMTAPTIKSITGTETNKDAVSSLLNKLTFGVFFKPGVEIEIQGEDSLSKVEKLDYKIYNIDKETGLPTTIAKEGSITSLTAEKGKVSIDEVGPYRVCVIATDKATNQSIEKCSDVAIKEIGVDKDGDGKPDMIDPDGDGCPDINIVLGKDPEGNWIKLNVDLNNDGIPDMNIDSKGTGKADLNVDTDNDKKPDLNLVVLTKTDSQETPSVWKPTICVKDQAVQYCTGTSAKPLINVDIEGVEKGSPPDGIPDINIDNIGDFKPHLNITKDGESKPYLNIVKPHDWKPDHDYKIEKFIYDSIGKDAVKPMINTDSDGDGRPDLNIDFNNDTTGSPADGIPDLNIDANYDGIPDFNIDGDGDGKPDYNLDVDDNGKPTKNVITITEWKPELNGELDMPFDTMEIKLKGELEDNGIKVEKPDGTFLPNYALKVDDITVNIDSSIKDKIQSIAKDKEIKNIYNLALYKDNIVVQPDNKLQVKLPVVEGLKNPQLVVEQADGTMKIINPEIADGFYVYGTDFLGKVSVIGDRVKEVPDPVNPEKPKDEVSNPDTSVKGEYSSNVGNAMGGANTGDETRVWCSFMGIISAGSLLILIKRRKQKDIH